MPFQTECDRYYLHPACSTPFSTYTDRQWAAGADPLWHNHRFRRTVHAAYRFGHPCFFLKKVQIISEKNAKNPEKNVKQKNTQLDTGISVVGCNRGMWRVYFYNMFSLIKKTWYDDDCIIFGVSSRCKNNKRFFSPRQFYTNYNSMRLESENYYVGKLNISKYYVY